MPTPAASINLFDTSVGYLLHNQYGDATYFYDPDDRITIRDLIDSAGLAGEDADATVRGIGSGEPFFFEEVLASARG